MSRIAALPHLASSTIGRWSARSKVRKIIQRLGVAAVATVAIIVLALSACETSEPIHATNIDEAGVWTLTHYRLASDKSFRMVGPDARDGFLLDFDQENGIVRAAACSDNDDPPDVRESTCEKDDPDEQNWVCSCYRYTFSGGTMVWEEFADAPQRAGRRYTVSVYPPDDRPGAAVFFGLPNSTKKSDGGLFQSDGKSARHQFDHRDDGVFAASGCARACR